MSGRHPGPAGSGSFPCRGGPAIPSIKSPCPAAPARTGTPSFWLASSIVWAVLIFVFSTSLFSDGHTGSVLHRLLEWLHLDLSPALFASEHLLVRKLAHFTEYAVLALLLQTWLKGMRPAWPALYRALAVAGLAGLYSLTDELHQAFVPDRTASLRDCAIDTLGAACGLLAYAVVRLLVRRLQRTSQDSLNR